LYFEVFSLIQIEIELKRCDITKVHYMWDLLYLSRLSGGLQCKRSLDQNPTGTLHYLEIKHALLLHIKIHCIIINVTKNRIVYFSHADWIFCRYSFLLNNDMVFNWECQLWVHCIFMIRTKLTNNNLVDKKVVLWWTILYCHRKGKIYNGKLQKICLALGHERPLLMNY
jgi:hypothetical protein